MDKMQEFIKILKTEPNKAYGFIGNYYTQFTKDELANIIKEFIYRTESEKDFYGIHEDVAIELEACYGEENE